MPTPSFCPAAKSFIISPNPTTNRSVKSKSLPSPPSRPHWLKAIRSNSTFASSTPTPIISTLPPPTLFSSLSPGAYHNANNPNCTTSSSTLSPPTLPPSSTVPSLFLHKSPLANSAMSSPCATTASPHVPTAPATSWLSNNPPTA